MQVFYNINDFPKLENAVVTAGTYDGVHKGHQKILARLKESAQAIHGKTVVITYWPHPRKILAPESFTQGVLYTLEERIAILEEYGIDYLLVITFTKEFSKLSSEEYIYQILVNGIGTKKLIIGYDHRFGHNREGGIDYLKKNASRYDFDMEEIPREDIESIGISSSAIRKALATGDLDTANKYLGKPFHLIGHVVYGKQLGRKIGYPTANLQVQSEDKIIPSDGVYAVKVKIDANENYGMMNIGFRPTVEGTTRSLEVHLFNYNDDIYGKDIEVTFIKFLRKEKKFEGLEALKQQLEIDKLQALLAVES